MAALEIAAELRANALEAELEALRRRAVSPAQLRAVLEELRTLRAKTEALKQGCVMTQRLVRPTVESAIACLRLDAAEGARQGSLADGAAAGGRRRRWRRWRWWYRWRRQYDDAGVRTEDLDDSRSEDRFRLASDGGERPERWNAAHPVGRTNRRVPPRVVVVRRR